MAEMIFPLIRLIFNKFFYVQSNLQKITTGNVLHIPVSS